MNFSAVCRTRRWSIEPLPTNPNNTLIIQVLVTPNRVRGAADAGSVGRLAGEARMMTVKTSAVSTAPIALIAALRCHPGSRERSQWRTMPNCESVNEMNTPIA